MEDITLIDNHEIFYLMRYLILFIKSSILVKL